MGGSEIKYPEEIKEEHIERTLNTLLYYLDNLAPKELLRPEPIIHRNDTGES